MTTLERLKQEVNQLPAAEKAELIATLSGRMGAPITGIVHTLGVNGGRATIVRTRIPVWILIRYQQMGANDAEILQHFPSLTAGDLLNAYAYYASYTEEIDRDIAEQQEEE